MTKHKLAVHSSRMSELWVIVPLMFLPRQCSLLCIASLLEKYTVQEMQDCLLWVSQITCSWIISTLSLFHKCRAAPNFSAKTSQYKHAICFAEQFVCLCHFFCPLTRKITILTKRELSTLALKFSSSSISRELPDISFNKIYSSIH